MDFHHSRMVGFPLVSDHCTAVLGTMVRVVEYRLPVSRVPRAARAGLARGGV